MKNDQNMLAAGLVVHLHKNKPYVVVYVHRKLLCDNTHTMYQTWCEKKKDKNSGICTWKTAL
jgi:uncharacterized protein YlbG (UPF0298 family)